MHDFTTKNDLKWLRSGHKPSFHTQQSCSMRHYEMQSKYAVRCGTAMMSLEWGGGVILRGMRTQELLRLLVGNQDERVLDVVQRGACRQAGCCSMHTTSLLQRKFLWDSRNDGASCQWATTQSGTLSSHPLVHIHFVIEDTLLILAKGRACDGCCPLMDVKLLRCKNQQTKPDKVANSYSQPSGAYITVSIPMSHINKAY